jgi:hypothetical protein
MRLRAVKAISPRMVAIAEHDDVTDRAHLDTTTRNSLPRPARNERGEGQWRGVVNKISLLSPALSSCGGGEGVDVPGSWLCHDAPLQTSKSYFYGCGIFVGLAVEVGSASARALTPPTLFVITSP